MPPVDLVEAVIGKSLRSVKEEPDQNHQSDSRQAPAITTRVIRVFPSFHPFLMRLACWIRNLNSAETATFRVPPMGLVGDLH